MMRTLSYSHVRLGPVDEEGKGACMVQLPSPWRPNCQQQRRIIPIYVVISYLCSVRVQNLPVDTLYGS